jgi:hypothetical protein
MCSWQRGFCHGTFNAGLVHLTSHAFPDHRIRFHAEKSHAPYLKEALSVACPGAPTIGLEIISHDLGMPRTAQGSLRRFRLLFQLVQSMRRNEVACWIFADMGGSALTILRYLMRLGRVTVPVVVIAHGLFEPLGWTPAPRFEDLTGLRGPSLSNLRLVVLGEHIIHALQEQPLYPRHDIRLLPHPVLDLGASPAVDASAHRFVFPGVPDKGLTSFARLAAEVRAGHPEVTFAVAGFASSEQDTAALQALDGIAQSPLSIREYFHRLSAATYGIWFSLHDPDPYQYRASGTIPDLLACGRPAVFKRNSMVDAYFHRFGPLGYSCDSWSDLVQRVKRMTVEDSHAAASDHHAAVQRARNALLPRSLAPVFRDIVLSQKRATHV